MAGKLYLCATPIGNLEDITLRALRVLKEVDLIAAEDTRHTLGLLNHFKITKPLISYYKQNEKIKSNILIEKALNGENIAIVSDAGTPGISDPGEEIVKEAIKNNIEIVPLNEKYSKGYYELVKDYKNEYEEKQKILDEYAETKTTKPKTKRKTNKKK